MQSGYGFTNYKPTQRARKEPKISLLFRRTADEVHTGGLESLVISEDGSQLYTASRDATVRCWSTGGERAGACTASFVGHSSWVNDAVLVNDLLVTCSSDHTLSLWDANSTGIVKSMDVICKHTDYVTRLACAPEEAKVASAGLRGQVAIWDIESAKETALEAFSDSCIDLSASFGSVYALDMDAHARLLAVGSPGGCIRLTDSRSPQSNILLKGHSDNIRSLLISPDGRLCLSASSDKTIRFWDTGQQRCIQTMAVHTDSVWALATEDFQSVISGGRDCCVYRTQLATRSSELLLKEEGPVVDLALGHRNQLWTATSQSPSARCYDVPAHDHSSLPPPSPRTPSRTNSGRMFYAAPSPQMRLRQTRHSFGFDNEPPLKKPRLETPGLPPLIRCSTLLDRRRILAKDSKGQYSVWDVTNGREQPLAGEFKTFEEAEASLFRPEVNVPPWFSPDVKTGSVCLHLETPSCFSAEIYAADLGFEDSTAIQKYNFGENLLKAALEKWMDALSFSYVSDGSSNGASPSQLASKSCFQLDCKVPPMLLGHTASSMHRVPYAKSVNELGVSTTQDIVPNWVHNAVLKSRFAKPDELQCGFVVLPAEGSGLSDLLKSRLTAPRILTMEKIASYVTDELNSMDNASYTAHLPYDAESARSAAEQGQSEVEGPNVSGIDGNVLEFTCNGVAVPPHFSVGAIKAYIWRRSGSPEIKYRVYNPKKPAPYAEVKPPSQAT